MSNIPPPYSDTTCIAPPYNATNFNTKNSAVLSTLITYANNSPNYPWDSGSDAQQIYRSRQNVVVFNTLNQQVQAQRTANGSLGYPANATVGSLPYPRFKTDAERLMYIQGMSLTASRNRITGNNPSAPMGVPCSTIYQIINS